MKQLAPCDAGGHRYLIDLASVSSIQQSNVIATFPTVDEPVGKLMAHGSTIPLVSLAQRLGDRPSDPCQRQYCLIVGQGTSRWGLLVDRVHRTREADPSQIVPLPDELGCDWSLGAMLVSDSMDFATPTSSQIETVRPILVLDPTMPIPSTALRETRGSKTDRPTSRAVPQFNPPSNPSRQLLLFASATNSLDGTPGSYGFPAAQIQQIMQRPTITPIPLAPEFVVGLAEWRNSVVPVIDLDRTMNASTHSNDSDSNLNHQTRLVIARRPNAKDVIGFLATTSVKSLRLTNDSASVKPVIGNHHASFGTFHVEGLHVTLPNLDAVFSQNETVSIEPREPAVMRTNMGEVCAV